MKQPLDGLARCALFHKVRHVRERRACVRVAVGPARGEAETRMSEIEAPRAGSFAV